MKKSSPTIVIIHPGSLGDSLLALAGIRGLRNLFLQHRLIWMGSAEMGRLLMDCQEVDDALSLDGPFFSQLYFPFDQWGGRLKQILAQCTHCVAWITDDDGFLEENLKAFGIRCVIVQSPRSSLLSSFHTEQRYLEILEPWGLTAPIQNDQLTLSSPLEDSFSSTNFNGPTKAPYSQLIVIHPGSGSSQKCADPSLLAEMARNLIQSTNRTLVILGGPADEQHVQNMLREMRPETYHLVRDQPLSSVAYILSRAALYIGHDSGVSHLAAALGTPTIAIFGPTDPAQWAPRGDHVSVVRGLSCECTNWKQVQECDPKPCLTLSVDIILQQAEHVLHSPQGKISVKPPALEVAEHA